MALQLLRPALDAAGRSLARLGVHADQVSWLGFALGVAAATAIALRHHALGLALLLASRACDGLDGALARATKPTDRGAFLDITLDFLFYASIPLAFALADPGANALAAALLLQSPTYPSKGLYYLGGLTEATETLACFVMMCLWPAGFALLATAFAAMCGLTIATRLWAGWNTLKN